MFHCGDTTTVDLDLEAKVIAAEEACAIGLAMNPRFLP
jgi:hypothetical protein